MSWVTLQKMEKKLIRELCVRSILKGKSLPQQMMLVEQGHPAWWMNQEP